MRLFTIVCSIQQLPKWGTYAGVVSRLSNYSNYKSKIVGGMDVTEFAGKLYLPALAAILENYMESLTIKLVRKTVLLVIYLFLLLTVAMSIQQVIKTIAEFCYGNKNNQNLARNLSITDSLINQMCTLEEDVEMVGHYSRPV